MKDAKKQIRCHICKRWYAMRPTEHRYDGKPKYCPFCLKTIQLNQQSKQLKSEIRAL